MKDKSVYKAAFYSMLGAMLIIFLLAISSCQERRYQPHEEMLDEMSNENEDVSVADRVEVGAFSTLRIKEIHGCEYILYRDPNGVAMSHHAACSNSINHTK